MKLKYKKIMFMLCYFVTYLSIAVEYCQLITYFINVGYDATQRGMMLALGGTGAILIQIVIGYLCDRYHTIKKFLYVTHLVFMISSYVIYHFSDYNIAFHMILSAVNIGTSRVVTSVTDSWILESGDEVKNSYGALRAFGSIGWVVGSDIVALLSIKYGYEGIAVACLLSSVLVFAVCLPIEDAQKRADKKIDVKEIGILAKNKPYTLMILILFFIFMMSASLDITIVDKLNILGSTEQDVNIYWIITGIVELPLFFSGQRIAKRIKDSNILIIATSLYILRFILYGFSTTITQIMAISILQTCTFPLIQICSKTLIDQHVPMHLKSSGQQIANALYFSSSTLLSPLVAGIIEKYFDVNVALFAFAGAGIISLLLTGVYIRYEKKSFDGNNCQ